MKTAVGCALPLEQEISCEVRGRDQVSGMPRTITVTSTEINQALTDCLQVIITTVRTVLEKTPPELASDVIDQGIVLTGGGALLRRIADLISTETGVPCYVAEDPLRCVAIGAGIALEHLEVIRRSLPPKRSPWSGAINGCSKGQPELGLEQGEAAGQNGPPASLRLVLEELDPCLLSLPAISLGNANNFVFREECLAIVLRMTGRLIKRAVVGVLNLIVDVLDCSARDRVALLSRRMIEERDDAVHAREGAYTVRFDAFLPNHAGIKS